MEQYLGQFLGNFIASLQGETLSNTLVSGFMMLAGFTLLAYLVFRIALIALKVGTVTAVLAVIASMGMPTGAGIPSTNQTTNHGANHEVKQIKSSPNKRESHFSMPDLGRFVSEERLREVFLSYIRGIHK